MEAIYPLADVETFPAFSALQAIEQKDDALLVEAISSRNLIYDALLWASLFASSEDGRDGAALLLNKFRDASFSVPDSQQELTEQTRYALDYLLEIIASAPAATEMGVCITAEFYDPAFSVGLLRVLVTLVAFGPNSLNFSTAIEYLFEMAQPPYSKNSGLRDKSNGQAYPLNSQTPIVSYLYNTEKGRYDKNATERTD